MSGAIGSILIIRGGRQALLRSRSEEGRSWNQGGGRVKLKTEARLVQDGDIEVTLGGNRFVEEQVAKNGLNGVSISRVGKVLLEWCVGLRNHIVVRVWS